MKVNFNTFNYISNIKTFKRGNVSLPACKSQPANDIFIRTVQIEDKKQDKQVLPEYLYHLTNQKCYKSIMRSGKIKPSRDTIDGVYMFDMKDFQNNWRTNLNYQGSRTLAEDLINQAIKKEKGLVLLRIPTKKLDPDNFAIRPQDELEAYLKSDDFNNLQDKYGGFYGTLEHREKLPDYIRNGYTPQKAQEFFEEGRAIEYIHKGAIDVGANDVQKIYELPDVNQETFLDYGMQHFTDLFDNLNDASEKINLVA